MNNFKKISHTLLTGVENLGLLVIALATIIAMSQEVLSMYQAATVTLADLLLLFIYLEVLAMIAIYLDCGQLPVRMPLYIAIIALSRYLILDMKSLDTWRILGIAGAMLGMALAVLIIRFGHIRFPYDTKTAGE